MAASETNINNDPLYFPLIDVGGVTAHEDMTPVQGPAPDLNATAYYHAIDEGDAEQFIAAYAALNHAHNAPSTFERDIETLAYSIYCHKDAVQLHVLNNYILSNTAIMMSKAFKTSESRAMYTGIYGPLLCDAVTHADLEMADLFLAIPGLIGLVCHRGFQPQKSPDESALLRHAKREVF